MNYVYAIAGLALSVFVANGLFKAGKFKATASKETLLGAGFGWVANIPFGTVRLIAWLEILGAIGAVLAPVAAYVTGLVSADFASTAEAFKWVGVAAAAGLALTMLVAFIMHAVRGETKYTAKMTVPLFLVATAAAVLQAVVTLPLF